jgi:hypothetical protein
MWYLFLQLWIDYLYEPMCYLFLHGLRAVYACVEICFASLISGNLCCTCVGEDGDSNSHTACLLLKSSGLFVWLVADG